MSKFGQILGFWIWGDGKEYSKSAKMTYADFKKRIKETAKKLEIEDEDEINILIFTNENKKSNKSPDSNLVMVKNTRQNDEE